MDLNRHFSKEDIKVTNRQRKSWGFPGGTSGKGSACQCRRHKRWGFDPWVKDDPLEKEMATLSSIVWKFPWTEQPGGLFSMVPQRAVQDWATVHTHRHKGRSYSASSVTREMQVRITVGWYFTPVRMAVIKKRIGTCWQECGGKGNFVHCWWKGKLVQS